MVPGIAFGSGEHETTRSCLEIIDGLSLEGKTVLDLGCGTGILSLAAALKGAKTVIAVDIDPQAVVNTTENVHRNGMENIISPVSGELYSMKPACFDLVIANIFWDVLLDMVDELAGAVKTGGMLLLSGIETGRDFDIRRSLNSYFSPIRISVLDEFVSMLFRRI